MGHANTSMFFVFQFSTNLMYQLQASLREAQLVCRIFQKNQQHSFMRKRSLAIIAHRVLKPVVMLLEDSVL